MTFKEAFESLKLGHRVARKSWGGNILFLEIQEFTGVKTIMVKVASDKYPDGIYSVWAAPRESVAADDWHVVEN